MFFFQHFSFDLQSLKTEKKVNENVDFGTKSAQYGFTKLYFFVWILSHSGVFFSLIFFSFLPIGCTFSEVYVGNLYMMIDILAIAKY